MAVSKTPFQYRNTDHILIALACVIAMAFIVGYLLGKTNKPDPKSNWRPAPINGISDLNEDRDYD